MNIFIFLEGGINQTTTLEMWHVNPIICFRRDQIQDYSLLNFNEGKQRYIAFFQTSISIEWLYNRVLHELIK